MHPIMPASIVFFIVGFLYPLYLILRLKAWTKFIVSVFMLRERGKLNKYCAWTVAYVIGEKDWSSVTPLLVWQQYKLQRKKHRKEPQSKSYSEYKNASIRCFGTSSFIVFLAVYVPLLLFGFLTISFLLLIGKTLKAYEIIKLMGLNVSMDMLVRSKYAHMYKE